jgi:hypothetical protein
MAMMLIPWAGDPGRGHQGDQSFHQANCHREASCRGSSAPVGGSASRCQRNTGDRARGDVSSWLLACCPAGRTADVSDHLQPPRLVEPCATPCATVCNGFRGTRP